jgi:hypothetical protein
LITKESVAYHEAGHALIALASPICNYIGDTYVFNDDSQWRGTCETNLMKLNKKLPTRDFEEINIAVKLAGPCSEYLYSSNSIELEYRELIISNCSILRATTELLSDVERFTDVNSGWFCKHGDLETWAQRFKSATPQTWEFMLSHPESIRWLEIEKRLISYLRGLPVKSQIKSLALHLIEHGFISGNDLRNKHGDGLSRFI